MLARVVPSLGGGAGGGADGDAGAGHTISLLAQVACGEVTLDSVSNNARPSFDSLVHHDHAMHAP